MPVIKLVFCHKNAWIGNLQMRFSKPIWDLRTWLLCTIFSIFLLLWLVVMPTWLGFKKGFSYSWIFFAPISIHSAENRSLCSMKWPCWNNHPSIHIPKVWVFWRISIGHFIKHKFLISEELSVVLVVGQNCPKSPPTTKLRSGKENLHFWQIQIDRERREWCIRYVLVRVSSTKQTLMMAAVACRKKLYDKKNLGLKR